VPFIILNKILSRQRNGITKKKYSVWRTKYSSRMHINVPMNNANFVLLLALVSDNFLFSRSFFSFFLPNHTGLFIFLYFQVHFKYASSFTIRFLNQMPRENHPGQNVLEYVPASILMRYFPFYPPFFFVVLILFSFFQWSKRVFLELFDECCDFYI